MPEINSIEAGNFINGQLHSVAPENLEVISPLSGEVMGSVNLSTAKDLELAVASARGALEEWSSRTLKERVEVFYNLRSLLIQHEEELTNIIHLENGKTRGEAKAEVLKAIELTEFACSLPQIINDEVQEVSKGVECRSSHVPLGIVASIVPFNFPLMVPMWSIPNALALGNCMILKPSEQVPFTMQKVAGLFKEAGLPNGVFNIVNGDRDIVEAICDHPEIAAVSFVGSTKIAKLTYQRATGNLKRCLALGGAKNHLIVLPDADAETAAANITASMSGCAGQRCMAASAMVAVGSVNGIIDKICDEARKVIPGESLGSVISKEAKERIERYITEAESAGAKILVDGRDTVVPGSEGGYYVGPTIIDQVTPDMAIAKEEVFGPVLAILRTENVDEAIKIENSSNYGNASSVFTQNGAMADYVTERVSVGMVGVNIGVPVPREPFSFGGWNQSRFGVGDITGKSSIEFWTKLKKTTTKWESKAWTNWMS